MSNIIFKSNKISQMFYWKDRKKILNGWTKLNGELKKIYTSWEPLEITYSGAMTYEDDEVTGYRYYEITESGTLTNSRTFTADVWFCGGGGAGGNGGESKSIGGGGGGGGFTKTLMQYTIPKTVTIQIGAGSTNNSWSDDIQLGGNSKFNSKNVSGGESGYYGGDRGTGGEGGSGGGSGGNGNGGGIGEGITTVPFDSEYFKNKNYYTCAGGAGGGGEKTTVRGGAGGSDGSNGGNSGSTQGTGGNYGGGKGGRSPFTDSTNGTFYGAGGGGAYYASTTKVTSGYQGVCILRVPLSEFSL